MKNLDVTRGYIGLITVDGLRLQYFLECESISDMGEWKRKGVLTLIDEVDRQVEAKFERVYNSYTDDQIIDDLLDIAKGGF